MENKNIDHLLDSLQKKNASAAEEFSGAEEFKSRFFERIRQEKQRSYRRLRFYTVWSAAACVVLGTVLLPLLMPEKQTYEPDTSKASAPPEHIIPVIPAAAVTDRTAATASKEALPPPEEAVAEVMVHDAVNTVSAPMRLSKKAPMLQAPAAAFAAPSVKFNTSEYKSFTENNFVNVKDRSLSTFGADVDTASYTNMRHWLTRRHQLPPADAVRTEELINFFRYDYPAPADGEKFSVSFETATAPWQDKHKLVLIGVQAANLPSQELPPANYVFLVDNSGSMYDEMEKVITALTGLIGELRSEDRLSLITYGGGVDILLDGISAKDKAVALQKVRQLVSDGYTPGGEAIQKAYQLARKHFIKKGNNRIVLITDGDFNVGVSSEAELVQMVSRERNSLIYLSVFGMGDGNYHENKLKMLANKGNGNYYYVDSLREASNAMKACFANRMFAIARDVKFQIEFNPARVKAYRLLGYELRKLEDRDFNDDTKDAGEVGVDHQVTVIYEIVPVDAPEGSADGGEVDKLKYQTVITGNSSELLTCKIRYQDPAENRPSELRSFVLADYTAPGNNLRWASAAAEFAMLLKNSKHKGNASYRSLLNRARIALGSDEDGKRAEFLTLVRIAAELSDALK
ncbi:MAG: DUF3520 domain-containing protein [Lentisphaerae bacterium]|nr:DUF3520 domain-containing protein [Lentisphaerota bacterium]